ncbi:hypothetical protein EJ04DRAFT_535620 [Polyplosphaeria fusca]|uniref:Uncharacterized protein n=1 Tax=Polyplosphaeria fusca TaxID=682080 RepID=A0A9P4QY11_9PLEO|nr:hypothetical protein EJ04DRAFT_535620 [Polyplosphaeria fusca]
MDFVQDNMNLLLHLLPPSLYNPLFTFCTTALGLARAVQTHLTPLILRLISQPDITTLIVLTVVIFVSLKILDMAYRAVMFWINLVFKLAFYVVIAAVGIWVYNRGVDGFAEDVQKLAEFWGGEYEKYSGEVRRFQQEEQAKATAKGYGYKEEKRRLW